MWEEQPSANWDEVSGKSLPIDSRLLWRRSYAYFTMVTVSIHLLELELPRKILIAQKNIVIQRVVSTESVSLLQTVKL